VQFLIFFCRKRYIQFIWYCKGVLCSLRCV